MARRRALPRGYSLIELAIALVVVGLIVGGALLPLKARYESGQIRETQELLQRAKDAVHSYALQNRTTARKVKAAHDGVTYDAPAGRPYLPCPDINNDGIEDRMDIPGDEVLAHATLTIAGVCVEQKGLLPWKTLGVPATDPWGTRLTYRVDMAFSHPVIGFDSGTRADIFDRAAPLTLDAGEYIFTVRASRHQIGNIVCEQINNGSADAIDDGCPNGHEAQTNVLAGVFHVTPATATAAFPLTLGARRVPPHNAAAPANMPTGLVEGAAFVIVSHGKNGFGGINRDGQCRAAPPQTGDLIETANAYYRATHPLVTIAAVGCASPATAPVVLYENIFGSAPVAASGDARARSDDIVIWSGGNELMSVMLRGGVLPVGRFELLPE